MDIVDGEDRTVSGKSDNDNAGDDLKLETDIRNSLKRINDLERSYRSSNWLQWGVLIVTALLVIVTAYLAWSTRDMAVATKDMAVATKDSALAAKDSAATAKDTAEIMRRDFIVRNEPKFSVETPKLEKGDKEWRLSFKVENVSTEGTAYNTFIYVIYHTIYRGTPSEYTLAKNVITGEGDKAKKVSDIPFDFIPTFFVVPKLGVENLFITAELESLIVVLDYHTVFDKQRSLYRQGFICKSDGDNFPPMTPDILEGHWAKIQEKGLLGKITTAE